MFAMSYSVDDVCQYHRWRMSLLALSEAFFSGCSRLYLCFVLHLLFYSPIQHSPNKNLTNNNNTVAFNLLDLCLNMKQSLN